MSRSWPLRVFICILATFEFISCSPINSAYGQTLNAEPFGLDNRACLIGHSAVKVLGGMTSEVSQRLAELECLGPPDLPSDTKQATEMAKYVADTLYAWKYKSQFSEDELYRACVIGTAFVRFLDGGEQVGTEAAASAAAEECSGHRATYDRHNNKRTEFIQETMKEANSIVSSLIGDFWEGGDEGAE